MLIFNLGGFLTGILTFLCFFGIESMLMASGVIEYADLILTVFFLIFGVIIEIVGLKPRIFFIPCWLLGIIGICVQSYKLWGWPSLVGGVIALIVSVKLLLVLAKKSETKKWNKVQQELNKYKQCRKSTPEDKNKKALYSCLFYNKQLDNSLEILIHNKTVIKLMLEDFSSVFSEEDIGKISTVLNNIDKMLQSEEMKWEKGESIADIEDLLLPKFT